MTSTSDFTATTSEGIRRSTDAPTSIFNGEPSRPVSYRVPSGRPHSQRVHLTKSTPAQEDDHLSAMLRDLRSELDIKKREEKILQAEISAILSQASVAPEQSRSVGLAVSRLNNNLLLVESSAKDLSSELTTIASLANNISEKVCILDEAKSRVVDCLQMVNDMTDLGTCSDGVDEAINKEEYELAAQYIHRFLTLDKAVFQFETSDQEIGDTMQHNYKVLSSAAQRLKGILEKKRDEALSTENVPQLHRFTKLFPLLNEHDAGLTRFASFVSKQIDAKGESNLKIMAAGGTDEKRRKILYADTLFHFFEGVADILDANLSVIESSYGGERLISFIAIIQRNVDDIACKVLEEFNTRRKFKQKKKMVRNWGSTNSASGNQTEQIDPMELDSLLFELCQMNANAEMYWKFVRKKFAKHLSSIGKVDDEDGKEESAEEAQKREERKKAMQHNLDLQLNRSMLGTKMQELSGDYILLEQFYMNVCIEKAIQSEQRDEDGSLTSSLIDDVIYLLRKCSKRALSCANADCVCAAMNNFAGLLQDPLLQHLQTVIKTGFPSSGFAAEALQTAQNAYNAIQHGKTDGGSEAQKDTFLTALNNSRTMMDMLAELKKSLEAEFSKFGSDERERTKLLHSLSQFDDFSRQLQNSTAHGVASLARALFKSRLKTSCETYVDLPHSLTSEQLTQYEANEPFISNFNVAIDKLFAAFEPLLIKDNYETLLLCTCSECYKHFERVIGKCQFNRFGALQLDREVRQLNSYLSAVVGWKAREKGARLSQIVSLLNVETLDEAVDVWQSSSSSRLISPSEAISILQLRSDLPHNLIVNLKL
ncbi:hypothetical protein WR25_07745 [Diploscapter pachys]|uniref:Conserved oligomeric Golgi complex subunit 4 n=1 Tax=Diploscapter pachys TaxID=2018661 RepID=A0A2A2J6I7_9BILA|nr:hypothetical protein WR25_07745 [Diploscapter pachys]